MRLAFVGFFTVAAALTANVRSADAQFNAPYCLINVGPGGSGIDDCSYRTLAQCRASIFGGAKYCTRNPAYAYAGPRARRQRGY
jgi:Protein of unknown function (DUF3551)